MVSVRLGTGMIKSLLSCESSLGDFRLLTHYQPKLSHRAVVRREVQNEKALWVLIKEKTTVCVCVQACVCVLKSGGISKAQKFRSNKLYQQHKNYSSKDSRNVP